MESWGRFSSPSPILFIGGEFKMLYKEFKVGNESYKLRLTTSDIINLEQELNCNPLMIFGK